MANVVEGYDDALLALRAERDENTCRLAFSPSEAVAMGAAIEEMEREEAKKRQQESGEKYGRGKAAIGSSKLDEPIAPHSRRSDTRTAEAVGMGKDSYRKAKEIVAAAEAEPDKYAHLVEKMDDSGRVNGWKNYHPCAGPERE